MLATFRAVFTGSERGKAFGIYGAMIGAASAVGLVLGGVLTDANLFGWGWRSVFFVNVARVWPCWWCRWSTWCSRRSLSRWPAVRPG